MHDILKLLDKNSLNDTILLEQAIDKFDNSIDETRTGIEVETLYNLQNNRYQISIVSFDLYDRVNNIEVLC